MKSGKLDRDSIRSRGAPGDGTGSLSMNESILDGFCDKQTTGIDLGIKSIVKFNAETFLQFLKCY